MHLFLLFTSVYFSSIFTHSLSLSLALCDDILPNHYFRSGGPITCTHFHCCCRRFFISSFISLTNIFMLYIVVSSRLYFSIFSSLSLGVCLVFLPSNVVTEKKLSLKTLKHPVPETSFPSARILASRAKAQNTFGWSECVDFLISVAKPKKKYREFYLSNCVEAERRTKREENNEQNILATDEMARINRVWKKKTVPYILCWL